MSSTHHALHCHFVFGTKHQRPLIAPEWRGRLHAYVGGTFRNLDLCAEIVGGVADHIHILASLHPSQCPAEVMRQVKRQSSAWVHKETPCHDFEWQDGYGVFSVSVSQVPIVKEYIANQETHHQKHDFRSEYESFLKRHGVAYKEEYLW